jgi:hypothetical protein
MTRSGFVYESDGLTSADSCKEVKDLRIWDAGSHAWITLALRRKRAQDVLIFSYTTNLESTAKETTQELNGLASMKKR